MTGVNIRVIALDLSMCAVLKIGRVFDFRVFLTDGVWDWFGHCDAPRLQECIEIGLSKFEKKK